MRVIPTRVHGVLDYLMALVLIVLPWLAGFPRGAAFWAMAGTGIAVLAYSLFTNYELGLIPRLKMSAHLSIDILTGFFLALSP